MKLDRINICELLGGWLNAIPLVEAAKNYYFDLFPFIPRKCPFKPGKYYGHNISIADQNITDVFKFISPSLLPNGIYRHIFHFYDNNDSGGVSIRFDIDIYDPANAENIMK